MAKNNLKLKIEGIEILGDLLKTKIYSCWSNDCANNNVNILTNEPTWDCSLKCVHIKEGKCASFKHKK